ncbi:hypothetical protein OC842_006011 [Tilletia horrida]|uniref:Uncharacterized protein n=1 Tax=Tilletia horrida TaxID=155126 RepID=A0AAN6G832_9BASI|nr:hypothetical protein OC842_006011 [Tilletia horrida]
MRFWLSFSLYTEDPGGRVEAIQGVGNMLNGWFGDYRLAVHMLTEFNNTHTPLHPPFTFRLRDRALIAAFLPAMVPFSEVTPSEQLRYMEATTMRLWEPAENELSWRQGGDDGGSQCAAAGRDGAGLEAEDEPLIPNADLTGSQLLADWHKKQGSGWIGYNFDIAQREGVPVHPDQEALASKLRVVPMLASVPNPEEEVALFSYDFPDAEQA